MLVYYLKMIVRSDPKGWESSRVVFLQWKTVWGLSDDFLYTCSLVEKYVLLPFGLEFGQLS